jgi:hypothetical protein
MPVKKFTRPRCNDQVLVDVHLYLKDVIKDLKQVQFDLMMESAEKHQNFCCHIPFTNRDAFLFWHVVFRLCRKPY